jgi:hypothetical protein
MFLNGTIQNRYHKHGNDFQGHSAESRNGPMGTMTSDPRPWDVSTGIRAKIVVAVVIRQGLTHRRQASTVAFRISSTD